MYFLLYLSISLSLLFLLSVCSMFLHFYSFTRLHFASRRYSYYIRSALVRKFSLFFFFFVNIHIVEAISIFDGAKREIYYAEC